MSAGWDYAVDVSQPDHAIAAYEEALLSDQVGHGEHAAPAGFLGCDVDQFEVEGPIDVGVLEGRCAPESERDRNEIVVVFSAEGEVELKGHSFLVTFGEENVEVEQVRVREREAGLSLNEGSHGPELSGGGAV